MYLCINQCYFKSRNLHAIQILTFLLHYFMQGRINETYVSTCSVVCLPGKKLDANEQLLSPSFKGLILLCVAA